MASDEEQSAMSESSPEPAAPQVSAPKKPKRLTLQERLAAAAKAKRKKAATGLAPASATSPESPGLRPESDAEDPGIPGVQKEESKAAPGEHNDDSQTTIDGSIADGTAHPPTPPENAESGSRLEQDPPLEAEHKNDAPAEPGARDRALAEKEKLLVQSEKKVLDKEETIRQLMEEGQELSKKELKLNERIRLLVANNTKLEASLRSYAEKNEELLLKLGEIEDLVKVHNLKSVDQLFDVLAAASQKNSDLQKALDLQKACNWEGKYKEIQRAFEKELDEKQDCKRQLSEAKVQLELLQNQSRLELELKTEIIAQLNHEIMAAKDESSTEVLRLEAKVESLRMENESFLKTSHTADASEDPDASTSTKKLVDYADFLKLSETHQNLQAQYVSLQETWKLIESSLQGKVEALSASVDTLKTSRAKSGAELKKLHAKLNAQLDEIEALKAELAALAEQNAENEVRVQIKSAECAELEDKIDDLRTAFGADRKNYDAKIQSLNEAVESLKNLTPTFTPSVSFDNLAGIQARRGAWGEPSYISENELDPHIYESHNPSMFMSNDEIYPSEALDVGETPLSSALGSHSTGATKHIQIINKMSASIRRLEVEILTLRDENEQLSLEIETAQRAVLDRLELDTQLCDLERHILSLQNELDEKSRRESTLLEVIGEKSEKVAELEADVSDLKDLMRQQVQQMIEMQGK
ncbi:hypothetical protein METBIDRAFT_35598 [Metschnikowia bicuspidata var. bicuspidata NRRL YB-4993]|uniref:TATA element modulatory factor 1 TATA binding domain-containing protein n=1 Tax=Metschnikowia bicuspidata var. bicuspidata NRRL YB-4993 TaxID=869754 RepID=A0A1A0HGQ0_9ASCO|nr:hypothetical protein METBIDRAFT_35598 [Metschnikowia bicuspidata var. bicuspidata NRRL YB-4993]OBA23057.1 hypothetical protein METBIDRAFT_35598 [Metschnikowia bicuspidata var. bicuspidata NRRL YB-4993]